MDGRRRRGGVGSTRLLETATYIPVLAYSVSGFIFGTRTPTFAVCAIKLNTRPAASTRPDMLCCGRLLTSPTKRQERPCPPTFVGQHGDPCQPIPLGVSGGSFRTCAVHTCSEVMIAESYDTVALSNGKLTSALSTPGTLKNVGHRGSGRCVGGGNIQVWFGGGNKVGLVFLRRNG